MLDLSCNGAFVPTTSSASQNTVNELLRLLPASKRFNRLLCNLAVSFRPDILTKPMPRETRQLSVFMLLEPSSTQPSSKLKTRDSSNDRLSLSQEISLLDASDISVGRENSVERNRSRKAEQSAYLFAAIASSVGVTFLAAGAVYYRFAWQIQGGVVPYTEMFGTFSLALGAAVGMEFWARWAHQALWHASLWNMHESHHMPRDGPLELNDVFAIINAIPAISLMSYGFFNKGLVPGLCFGAGLGITVFGMAYMFVHDGLVHRRFPVGPIADVPYFQKVAAAHRLHHSDKFNGVPYGLFLGPKEVEEIGGRAELEKLLQKRKKDA